MQSLRPAVRHNFLCSPLAPHPHLHPQIGASSSLGLNPQVSSGTVNGETEREDQGSNVGHLSQHCFQLGIGFLIYCRHLQDVL